MLASECKYITVANSIVEDYCAPLAVGDKLPDISRLCDEYNVSSITVQKALQCLVSKGLVRRIPRRGTFLAQPHEVGAPRIRKAPRTIRVLGFRNWRFTTAMRTLLQRYSERNPKVSFDVKEVDDAGIHQALARQGADMILVNEWRIGEFISNPTYQRQFLPLRELSGLHLDESAWFESVLKWCRNKDGELLSLPLNFSTVVSCTNRAYAGAPAGFTTDCTTEEFAAQLAEAQATGARQVIPSCPFLMEVGENRWPIWVRTFGGDLISADGRKCLLDTPESLEGIRFVVDLLHRRRVAALRPYTDEPQLLDRERLFASGHFLCTWTTFALTHSRIPFPVRFGPLPHARRRITHLRLDGLMVTRNCGYREDLRDFLNFVLLPENLVFLSENSDAFSAHAQLGRLFSERMTRTYEGFEWFIKSLDYAEPIWKGPWNELIYHIGTGLTPVWMGIESVEKTCREIVVEVDRRLNEVAETGGT